MYAGAEIAAREDLFEAVYSTRSGWSWSSSSGTS